MYSSDKLHFWEPASNVRENRGKPGEMGKAVKLSPQMERLAQDQFKLNQFNVLASDVISLNRSLPDVRLSG